jgi:hypothetical protein
MECAMVSGKNMKLLATHLEVTRAIFRFYQAAYQEEVIKKLPKGYKFKKEQTFSQI